MEERLERFHEMAQHVTGNLELAMSLAASRDPEKRALARQQLPMWADYVEQWRTAIERIEREIADGAAD